jgi:hypothetical protein
MSRSKQHSFVKRILLALGSLWVLAPSAALAEPPELDAISLVGELAPVDSDVLAKARGGASLRGGFGIEVTAVLRLMAEGQDVLSMTGAYGLTGGVSTPQTVVHSQGSPLAATVLENPIIVNSLDGVSLEQYREITVHLTDFSFSKNRALLPVSNVTLGGSGH